jgi:hypothetical protein
MNVSLRHRNVTYRNVTSLSPPGPPCWHPTFPALSAPSLKVPAGPPFLQSPLFNSSFSNIRHQPPTCISNNQTTVQVGALSQGALRWISKCYHLGRDYTPIRARHRAAALSMLEQDPVNTGQETAQGSGKKQKRFLCHRCQRNFARLEHLQRHERIRRSS